MPESFYHLIQLEKYNCEFVRVREPWKEYLRVNNLKDDYLLIDGKRPSEFPECYAIT